MKKNKDGTYKAGVIYELGVFYAGEWWPFYVGETTQPLVRMNNHRNAANSGKELLVYDYMRGLLKERQVTEMKLVEDYGLEGPADKEDEHIMRLLLADYTLMNMKKGSKAWMDNMLDIKIKMQASGHTSLRKYKEWDAEQRRIENDERHRLRVEEENKIPLIDRIKASTKFTDEEKLREMQLEKAQRKTAEILGQLNK